MRILLIDDQREKKDVDLRITQVERRYAQGLYALENEGPWDILYLDHDLMSFNQRGEMTGYDIMCWLERNPEYLPGKIELVTSNPAGRQRMQQVIDKLYE